MDGLVPETEFLDDATVSLDVCPLHVIEQPATLADHLEQATSTVVILLVCSKVVGQKVDTLGQNRDLNSSRACVGLMRLVLLDSHCLVECHP